MTMTYETNVGRTMRTRPISLGEAAALLKELAEFPHRGERVKAALHRVSRLVPMNYWRAFDVWYEKAKCFRDFEGEAILEAVRKKRELDAANELQSLRTRIEILESRLRAGDADFYGPAISVLGKNIRSGR